MADRNRNIRGIVDLGRLKNTAQDPITNKIILKTNVIIIPLHSVRHDNNTAFCCSFRLATTAGKKPSKNNNQHEIYDS